MSHVSFSEGRMVIFIRSFGTYKFVFFESVYFVIYFLSLIA